MSIPRKLFFPCGSAGNLQYRRPGFDPWVRKIPWRREWLPTPVFWPGDFHKLYSPWGRKESDKTEQLSLSLFQGNYKDFIFEQYSTQFETPH